MKRRRISRVLMEEEGEVVVEVVLVEVEVGEEDGIVVDGIA